MDKAKLVELENQYTQLYVGEMEGERGERSSTHSCMLERGRERGGREPVHTAVRWRDGRREVKSWGT